MKQRNGRLIVVVAVVGVLAVVAGGVVASQRGPRFGSNSAAAPLAGQTPSTTPVAVTPTKTPSSTPTPTATPSSAPVKVTLDLSKLPKGRDPQVPYLVGREVRGGAGDARKIPGTEQIQQIARRGNDVLAVVSKGTGTELLQLGYLGAATVRTPDVTTLVSTDDASRAAYGAVRTGSGGEALKGGIVYADATSGDLRKLQVPNGWDL
ncbi:MAG TPA: hypothetical protein VGD15_15900, partial [Kribbella sp.]